MKKFMKAIAFVTVMCLAFSTVAFAAGSAVLDEEAGKVLNITVTGAGDDEVALVVVASDAEDYDFSNPLYVDQTASVDDTASFTAVLTNATDVDAVDIYVGYSTYAATNARPEKIGEDVSLKPITEVSIVKFASGFVQGDEFEYEGQTGAGVWAELEVKAPKGVSASQMVWAIRYNENGSEKVKYSDAINVSGYGIGSAMEGPVRFALSFLNGSEEIASVEITKVDVIFLFTDGEEVLTNEADVGNKDPNSK